jgi:hypothetical protein
MSTLQATNLKHESSASNNIVLDASGNTTISGNAVVAGTLQANGVTGSVYPLVSGTAQASTSGTSIDFTGIPSWVKRVTVMFNGVSTNGTSNIQIQVGAGSFAVTNYYGYCMVVETTSTGTATVNTGLLIDASALAAYVRFGQIIISSQGNNVWAYSSSMGVFGSANARMTFGGGSTGAALSATLDRVRITTVGGTDTFDAGTINILYEG